MPTEIEQDALRVLQVLGGWSERPDDPSKGRYRVSMPELIEATALADARLEDALRKLERDGLVTFVETLGGIQTADATTEGREAFQRWELDFIQSAKADPLLGPVTGFMYVPPPAWARTDREAEGQGRPTAYATAVSQHFAGLAGQIAEHAEFTGEAREAITKQLYGLQRHLLELEGIDDEEAITSWIATLIADLKDIREKAPTWLAQRLHSIIANLFEHTLTAALGAAVLKASELASR